MKPLFFTPNRVWRWYVGGVLLDRFLGLPNPSDGHMPEEWLASTTSALNGEHSLGPDEGLSRVRLATGAAGPFLADLIRADPEGMLGTRTRGTAAELGVLSKFLDSATRLPIQCHPDRDFARRHYHSEHGKTESWIILGTRKVNGEDPYLLMGFKPGVTKDAFAAAIERSDVPAMVAMLHRVPSRTGDVWFIPGRFPHAIGPGNLILEVQEPSDWVVLPEPTCADLALPESERWGPIGPELGLECFEYRGETLEAVRKRVLASPVATSAGPDVLVECVIGPDRTDCFRVDRIRIKRRYVAPWPGACRVAIVTSGSGKLVADGAAYPLRAGEVVFLPYAVREISFESDRLLDVFVVQAGQERGATL